MHSTGMASVTSKSKGMPKCRRCFELLSHASSAEMGDADVTDVVARSVGSVGSLHKETAKT